MYNIYIVFLVREEEEEEAGGILGVGGEEGKRGLGRSSQVKAAKQFSIFVALSLSLVSAVRADLTPPLISAFNTTEQRT